MDLCTFVCMHACMHVTGLYLHQYVYVHYGQDPVPFCPVFVSLDCRAIHMVADNKLVVKYRELR